MGHSSFLSNYRNPVALLDGRRALIRPIVSADRDALRLFFRRLGPETMFLRFQYSKPSVSEQELQSYCECDYERAFTLIAEMEQLTQPRIVGVGRYDCLPNSRSAEVAFVVEDDEQGNGIGTHLLAQLAEVGRDQGLQEFVAETLTYNEIMLSIFRKYDPGLKKDIDGDGCRVTFSIAPARRLPSPTAFHVPSVG